MRPVLITGLLLVVVASGIGVSSAAPPPPPPPGAIGRADAILRAPRRGDLAGYVGQFADDATLIEKGQIVARGKGELLRYFQEHQRLTVTVLDASYGNPIMASESVSNMPDAAVPGVVIDCCFWARLATYHLDDAYKVDRIEFIENGATWGTSENPR